VAYGGVANMDDRIPATWNAGAHRLWLAADKQGAIAGVLAALNSFGEVKPLPLVLQLVYYVFLLGDYRAAADFLERVRPYYPRDVDLLVNLGVAYGRCGDAARSADCMHQLIAIDPGNVMAHDSLASSLSKLGRHDEAKRAGTRALELKDAMTRSVRHAIRVPAEGLARFLSHGPRINIISFSLWGANPRYLRGAMDNALQAPLVYPGWRLRYHVDNSVPRDLQDALAECGAEIVHEPDDRPLRERLAWRFKVANDPHVGRFLVRDVDSVVNPREAWAVGAWLASDRWFHAMRDWWTHTDLMLAGMWGGVAGVLPNLAAMLQRYRSPTMETPNIDQHFLGDQVWPLIRDHCLVHDRCFTPSGARPWALPDPPGDMHVGQDEYAVRSKEQAARLGNWIDRVPSLGAGRG
jgi:tetratricopeptide (TPR) repeat protein